MDEQREMVVPTRPVTPPKPVEFWHNVSDRDTHTGLLIAWRCLAPSTGSGPPQWYGLVLTGSWQEREWSTTARWIWVAYMKPWGADSGWAIKSAPGETTAP